MPGKPKRSDGNWLTLRNGLLGGAVLLTLIGLSLLLIVFQHNRRLNWKPLKLPLSIEAGEGVSGSFLAEHDERYEVEIEITATPGMKLEDSVTAVERPSSLDINWSVTEGNSVVAHGNCRDFLYISSTRRSIRDRVWRALLRAPLIDGESGTVFRGVGSFKGRKGRSYLLRAEVLSTIEELNMGSPHFGARLNRQFVEHHHLSSIPVAYCGFGALALSFFLLMTWILTAVKGKIKKKEPEP